MPRPNQPRTIASETTLARRVEHERTARGLSYEALAIQMTHAGCAINASALFRIEKGEPPRRITVDELAAFSTVFGVPIEQMLLPPEAAASAEVGVLIVKWHNRKQAALSASDEADEAWGRLVAYVRDHPEVTGELPSMLEKWSQHFFEVDHDFRVAHRMWDLTKDPKWGRRAKAALNKQISEDKS